MTRAEKKEQAQQARERLLSLLTPGDTVYGIVRHVSRSGMSRRIDFYVIKNNEPLFLTGAMAALGIGTFPRTGQGLRVDGCGMDMVFHCVYNLGRILWPGGDGKTVIGRNRDKKPETDGGYLLRHSQL